MSATTDPEVTSSSGRDSRRWGLIFTLIAILAAGIATAFFATVGPVDPLRDVFFSLAIALDLLSLASMWRAVSFSPVPWLNSWPSLTRVRILRNPAAGIVAVARAFPQETVQVFWRGQTWRYVLLVFSTLSYGGSIGAFVRHGPMGLVYLFWLASVLGVFLAYLPENISRPRLSRDEMVAVGALLVLGFVLRFYHLTTLPLQVHGDMASVGLQARAILKGDFPGWFSLGWATIPMWGFAHEAFTMLLFGDSLFGLRMSAVLAGMASLLGVYMLGREVWSPRVGLLALAALAIDAVHVHFSRIPSYIDPVPWMVWALYFVLRGLRRRSPTAWALAGMCSAPAINMYFSGRLLVLVIALFFLYLALFHFSLVRQNREGLLAFAFAFLFTFGPMLVVTITHFPDYMSRFRHVMLLDPGVYQHLLGKYQAVSLREIVLEQVQRTFLTYQYYGDTSTQFGYPHPMLNPWLAPFFLLGVGAATGRLRHPGNFVLAVWILLGLVFGSVLTVDAPFWPRLVVVVPTNALAVALGMNWVWTTFAVESRPRYTLLAVILVGILAWAGWQNWQTYVAETGQRAGFNDFTARVILSLGERPACLVRGEHSLNEREFQFLLKDRQDMEIDPARWQAGAQACAAQRGVVVAQKEDRYLVDMIVAAFPGGSLEEVRAPGGMPRLVIYRMP